MTHADIIKALGGDQKVAARVGCHRTRVGDWRHDGIPVFRWPLIVAMAQEQGLSDITMDALFKGTVREGAAA